MSTHSYHARARGGPAASSSPAHASVIAAALGTRALRFSFVDGDGEVEEEGLEADEFEVAHAVAPSSFSPSSAALPPPPPRGTVLDGAAIIFTAVASFPALSLPWSVSTMGWTGLAALTLCGVATAFYSCWLVSYLLGHDPSRRRKSEKNATTTTTTTDDNERAGTKGGAGSGTESEKEESADFCHRRYHDMAASILGHRTASIAVTPVQVVFCFGICVSSLLIGGTSLKALSRLLQQRGASATVSSSSPLTLSQWIAVYAAFQASSAFVPSLASSAAVAIVGSVAFLLFWFLATAYSAVAGVQQQKSSSPLPAELYSLAATAPHERAFAVLNGLGVALFAWSKAFAPEVQATLERPHGRTMRRSTLAAFGLLLPCYALIGGLGFWAFGRGSSVFVLLNMEPTSRGGGGGGGAGSPFEAPRAALAVAWLGVLVNLYALFAVYAFPVYECLDVFVARRVVDKIREKRRKEKRTESSSSSGSIGSPSLLATAVAARAAGRLLFCGCCTLTAAALPFFSDIAAVLGVLSLVLDFILPCLMFLRVRGKKLGKVAAFGLLGTASFYVLLGWLIMIAALRSLFLNAHTYKLFADI